jgi:aminoglycoside phosphotransferase (APT) family kinase protein
MPSLAEAYTNPIAEHSWNEARQTLGRPYAAFEHTRGEINDIYVIEDSPQAVVKIPHPNPFTDTKHMLKREVATLQLLEATQADLGIAIPHVLSEATEHNHPWAALHFVPGVVYDREALQRAFSAEELTAYGAKLGEFVGKMELSLSLRTLATKVDAVHGRCKLDRAEAFTRLSSQQNISQLHDEGLPNLARHVRSLREEYDELHAAGVLTPTAVGHDDLHWLNCIFDKQRSLKGIIDFAIVKPSTPARELRFAPDFGEEATQAAAAAYQDTTQKEISTELISFWNHLQGTSSSLMIASAGYNATPYVLKTMANLYPDVDWRVELLHENADQ